MAGDWIKMRVDLADDPAVIKMSNLLQCDEDTVVGKLHRLWSWADRHTIDGITDGVNEAWIDRYVSMKGFAASMVVVQWLIVTDDTIELPNFDRHNGSTAKKREENTIRQRLSRQMRDIGATGTKRTTIPRPFQRRVLERDQYRCVYCGVESNASLEDNKKTARLSIDHIIPAARGGKTTVENLATCCRQCNMEKSDRTPQEWGMEMGFLSDGLIFDGKTVARLSRKKSDRVFSSLTLPFKELRKDDNVSDAMEEAWQDWCRYRSEIKKPMTRTTTEQLSKKLAEWGEERAIAAINHTIVMGWQGLREPEPTPAMNGAPAKKPINRHISEDD